MNTLVKRRIGRGANNELISDDGTLPADKKHVPGECLRSSVRKRE